MGPFYHGGGTKIGSDQFLVGFCLGGMWWVMRRGTACPLLGENPDERAARPYLGFLAWLPDFPRKLLVGRAGLIRPAPAGLTPSGSRPEGGICLGRARSLGSNCVRTQPCGRWWAGLDDPACGGLHILASLGGDVPQAGRVVELRSNPALREVVGRAGFEPAKA
jgi:hypothetical protein